MANRSALVECQVARCQTVWVAMNSGPGDPGTRGPEDPSTEGCFALQQLPIAKIQLYSQSLPMLQDL